MVGTIVIKCGGSILSELSNSFFNSIKDLKQKGFQVVIVHGGGPEIEKMLTDLKVESEFVGGLRKTSKEALEIVEMILSGKVNKGFVANLLNNGIPSVGIAGTDGNLLKVKPINFKELGYVGEIIDVNTELVDLLLTQGYVPVISPIGISETYEKFNINADTAAASIAISLKAKHLLFVTNVPGILKEEKLLPELTKSSVQELIIDGTISGGMIPKVNAALEVLETGEINEITIINGKDSLLSLDGQLKGTKITNELEVV